MSCGVGWRHISDPTLLWLWCRLTAPALIRPLAWEPPYATDVVLKRLKKKKRLKDMYLFFKNEMDLWFDTEKSSS